MQVENTSLRLWTVRETPILPGQTVELPDSWKLDIEGHAELKIVEQKAKAGRPAKDKTEE